MKKICCFLTMILIVLTMSGCAAQPGNSEQNSSAESTLSVNESKAEIIESETSQAEKTSSEQNSVSPSQADSNSSAKPNFGDYPDLSHIEPVPVKDMTNAQIVEFLEESLSVDLPDSIVLKPNGKVDFTFEQCEDLKITNKSISLSLNATFNSSDLEDFTNSLADNSWRKEEKDKILYKNLQDMVKDRDDYLYYSKDFRRFYNIVSYVAILMFPSEDSIYNLYIYGVIDNDTNQNGIIYTK